jgi:hypothetical protein
MGVVSNEVQVRSGPSTVYNPNGNSSFSRVKRKLQGVYTTQVSLLIGIDIQGRDLAQGTSTDGCADRARC